VTFHLQIVVGYCAAARTIGQSTVPLRRSTQFAHSACTLTHKHKTSIAMQHTLSIILFLGVFPYHALDRFEEFENDSTPFEKKDFYQTWELRETFLKKIMIDLSMHGRV